MKKALCLILLLPSLAFATEFEGENALPFRTVCAEQFRAIFHDNPGYPTSVTAQRQEYRVAVTSADADAFITDVRQILGDYNQRDPKNFRLKPRDKPDSPDLMFITDTHYFRNVVGLNDAGQEVHRARIRKRKYAVVPRGMTVDEFLLLPPDQIVYARLADGDGVHSKWEFKVGSPFEDEWGELRDRDGVVDKISPVLLDSDTDLLQTSHDVFKENRDSVARDAGNLRLTRDGASRPVNDPTEIDRAIRRQGWLYEQGWKRKQMLPQIRMLYVRNAYRVYFPRPGQPGKFFEIQITFDSDIVQTYLKSGNADRSFPNERVIELKIPVEYADLSDEQLQAIGLWEVALIRKRYMELTPLKGRRRNAGKRSNLSG